MVFKSNAAETGPRVAESSAVPFEEVLAAEQEEIRESRRLRYPDATSEPGPNAAEAGPPVAESSAVAFEEVLAAEREEIRESRQIRYSNAPRDPGPIGLAFSGGGIRSATFCLGVLQSLASADLLRRFDYLSTV